MEFSKHFSRNEFLCNGNRKGICACGFDTVDAELIIVLDDLREHFGLPVHVFSGCRCPKYNKHVGGARRSQHKLGKASDVRIYGVSPRRVYDYLDKKYNDRYGLGLYKGFTHVDVRSHKARWGL